jgi:hypothetical protein
VQPKSQEIITFDESTEGICAVARSPPIAIAANAKEAEARSTTAAERLMNFLQNFADIQSLLDSGLRLSV